MTASIDVQLAVDGEGLPEASTLRLWAARTLQATGRDAALELSLRVVGADEMRRLNRDFRAVDRPTNVLAFPAGELPSLPDGEAPPLGDVVLCAELVRHEAALQGKTAGDHWAHLVVHGVLHLLGYDHEAEDEAREMEAVETRILGDHGIANPYAEPATGN